MRQLISLQITVALLAVDSIEIFELDVNKVYELNYFGRQSFAACDFRALSI